MKTLHYTLALAGGLWLSTAAGLHAQSYTFSTLAGKPLILDRYGDPAGGCADGTNSDALF